jgi:hypothetical protein
MISLEAAIKSIGVTLSGFGCTAMAFLQLESVALAIR